MIWPKAKTTTKTTANKSSQTIFVLKIFTRMQQRQRQEKQQQQQQQQLKQQQEQ